MLGNGRLDLVEECLCLEVKASEEKSERERWGREEKQRKVSQPRLATRQLGFAIEARGRNSKATWLSLHTDKWKERDGDKVE